MMTSRWLCAALATTTAWGCTDSPGSHAQPEQETTRGVRAEGPSSDDDWTDGYGADAGTENLPEPFSKAFDGLVQNTALWADIEVTLKAARVERGMDETWDDEGSWSIGPREPYVELDIELTNTTLVDSSLGRRKTWDLILRDGSRIVQTNGLEVALAPSGSVGATLRYLAEPDVDLSGALLELNGVERGVLAPERIPLDASYHPDIDVTLESVEGMVLESSRPEDFSRKRFEILSARVSRNSATEGRAQQGKMFVELSTDVTVFEDHGGGIWREDYAAVVDGKVSLPVNEIAEVFDDGTTGRVPVVFSLDHDVKELTLRFAVSWDDESVPETEWALVDVTL